MAQGKESRLLSSTRHVVSWSLVCSYFSPCLDMYHGSGDSLVWPWILQCMNLWLVLWTRISRNLAQWTEKISWTLLTTWTGYMMNPDEESSDRLNPEDESSDRLNPEDRMSLITRKSVNKEAQDGNTFPLFFDLPLPFSPSHLLYIPFHFPFTLVLPFLTTFLLFFDFPFYFLFETHVYTLFSIFFVTKSFHERTFFCQNL